MKWEQKLAILQEISDAHLRMRQPGDWYVSASMEIAKGGLLSGDYGNGTTPARAVEQHWAKYTQPGTVVVTKGGRFTWESTLARPDHWRRLADNARGAA